MVKREEMIEGKDPKAQKNSRPACNPTVGGARGTGTCSAPAHTRHGKVGKVVEHT